jgi:hypothetical protein
MKYLLLVVLAVVTAASTLAAEDTLYIRSYQTVDVCSSERRWLLAVDLGRILPSDSLVSFDITIGYDRTKLRPTDVLKEGTLSAGMSYAPFLNTVVPNEMRIAGGNIIKTVSGIEPLVAVTGDYLGTCGEIDTLGYPWPATFNSEFKKRITVIRRDSVKATANAKSNIQAGVSAVVSVVEVGNTDDKFEVAVRGAQLANDSVPHRFTFTSSHPLLVNVSDRGLKGIGNIETQANGSDFEVTCRVVDANPEFILQYQLPNGKRPDSVVITMRSEDRSECSCSKPAKRDTVFVTISPTVSVPSTDERIEIVQVHNDVFVIQCDHEEMKTVQVYSTYGQLLQSAVYAAGNNSVSTSNLANGSYFIRTICGNRQHVNLILK